MIEDRDIAGLKCAVLSRTQTPSLVVILLHGYGANRLDLATVAQYLLNHPDLANNNVSRIPSGRDNTVSISIFPTINSILKFDLDRGINVCTRRSAEDELI